MPIYPSELEKSKHNFYLLFVGGMPIGDGLKLTEADLMKDFKGKLPTAANYLFVYD